VSHEVAPTAPLIEVAEVMNAPANDLLLGRYIDRPLPGPVHQSLLLVGWVIPKKLDVYGVWATVDGRPVADLHLNDLGPDLAKAFPQVRNAERPGFRALLDPCLLQGAEVVEVSAELGHGSHIQLGRIRVRSTTDTGASEEESLSVPDTVPSEQAPALRRPRFWQRGGMR
jgi:hypothetical protein